MKACFNKKYNCSGPLAFKSQRIGYPSNQKLLHHYQQLYSYIHSQDTADSRVSWSKTMAIFDHARPKIIESTSSFPEFVPACKKLVYSICSFLKYSQFYSLMTRLDTLMPTQKKIDLILDFLNLYQHAKNQFTPSVHSSETVNFRVSWPDWWHPFLTMTSQKCFFQLLIYVNLYHHTKIQAVSLIYSGYMVDQKILQSDWLRTFWPISKW